MDEITALDGGGYILICFSWNANAELLLDSLLLHVFINIYIHEIFLMVPRKQNCGPRLSLLGLLSEFLQIHVPSQYLVYMFSLIAHNQNCWLIFSLLSELLPVNVLCQ